MKTRMNYAIGFATFLTVVLIYSFSNINSIIGTPESATSSRIESFTFLSNGRRTKGKIYLPAVFETNKNLPAIFLIDFSEQHFKVATDEFETVIDGVRQIEGFDALVVSLEQIADIDAKPEAFEEHYEIFKNMAEYVDSNYTKNSSRTFIGRGSESGIVLMSLLLDNGDGATFDNFIATDPGGGYKSALIKMLEEKKITKLKTQKRLHFSFSTTNNREKCIKINSLITDINDPNLQMKFVEYKSNDYENTYHNSFAEGLKYIFDK